jgi:hypothetical protein
MQEQCERGKVSVEDGTHGKVYVEDGTHGKVSVEDGTHAGCNATHYLFIYFVYLPREV